MQTTLTPLKSFSTLRCAGEKTPVFLQGQLTCDMQLLSSHGAYSLAALCDHRGRMLANFWVMKWQTDFLLILPKNMASQVARTLQKYAVFSKVAITPDDHFFIAALSHFVGEKNNAIFIALPSEHRYVIIAEQPVSLQATMDNDEIHWHAQNIHDHLCILSPETSFLFTPQMIALEKLGGVSFTKGCYVGQEIVARTQYLGTLKRHLQSFTLQSDTPLQPGDSLKNDLGEITGIITTVVKSADNCYVVLAVMQNQLSQ